ncbi:NHL domain-containing protein [Rugosimonospora acidiphila]
MNHHLLRWGIAATVLTGGLTGLGFTVGRSASAAPDNVGATVDAVVTQPATGTLTQVSSDFAAPVGVSAFNGTVYMSNTSENQVTELNSQTGVSNPFAGLFTGVGESGDGGPASAATLNQPMGTAEDAAGNVYIADTRDNVIREVDASTGIIARFAGSGKAGDKKPSGKGVKAQFYAPQAVAVDAAGDVFVADTGNNRVDEVLPNGKIVGFAGTGKPGYAGDRGKATKAKLNQPTGLAIDGAGDVYIADAGNDVIRRVDAKTGKISTVAGDFEADQADDGVGGFSGDGGPATSARLYDPEGVALDSAGDLFIADRLNNAIREVTPDGNIFTVVNQAATAGAAPAAGKETNGPATNSKLNGPTAVAVDNSNGTLWIADTSNGRISKVTGLAQSGTGAGPVAP